MHHEREIGRDISDKIMENTDEIIRSMSRKQNYAIKFMRFLNRQIQQNIEIKKEGIQGAEKTEVRHDIDTGLLSVSNKSGLHSAECWVTRDEASEMLRGLGHLITIIYDGEE